MDLTCGSWGGQTWTDVGAYKKKTCRHLCSHGQTQQPWTVTKIKDWLWDSADVYRWIQHFSVFYLPSSPLLLITLVPSFRLSQQSCQSASLEPEELSVRPSQKLSLPRSGPLFNYTFDFSPPFFLFYHLSTPHSQPTHTVAIEFHSRPNPYFQDNRCFDTHSFPILQSGGLNRNWRFNFWNETREFFWNWLSPPALLSPFAWVPALPPPAPRQSLSSSWSAEYSQFLRLYGDVGEMATSKALKKKVPRSSHMLHSKHLFPHTCCRSSRKPFRQMRRRLKSKGLFSVLLPAGCWVAI